MANTVKLTIKVDDDGSLNVVAKEAKAAAAATDKLGTSTDKLSNKKNRHNKLEKGTAQLGANSTKSFAKQAQTIGGGLVPAYAVLAANVFALSAAFQFLKNAADVTILEQSQIDYARNTGVALQSVTARLREASDGLLGFSAAGQAAAIGLAKGFSPKQMEDLAKGARKASTALGRDFADSFDRLVRGASKAEPELLDELGITLRLETATKAYAKAIDVEVKSLTAAQRSQAVLIETQKQLNDLFGAVEAKSNPFVKLSKTLEDLVKTATQYILPVFAFLADTINKSGAAAVAAFGLLALNIAKAAIPMDSIKLKFGEWATASATAVTEASEAQIKYRQQLKATADAVASLRAGAAQTGAKGLMTQNKKLGGSALLAKVASGVALSPAQKGQLNKILKDAEFSYKRHGKITTGMFTGVNIELVRDFRQSFQQMDAKAMSTGKVVGTVFTKAKLQAQVFGATVKNVVAKSFGFAGRAAEKMGKAIGGAMKFAGIVGILVMLGELISKVFNSPYTILLNVSKLMDGLLSGLIMTVNLTVKGVLGLFSLILTGMGKVGAGIGNAITGSIRGVLGGLDFVINSIVDQINGFIETLNLVSGMEMATIGFQSNMASSVDHVKEAKSAAVDLTGAFTEFNTEVSISQSLVESTAGGLKKFEEGRDAIQAAKESLKSFNELSKKVKADITGISAGIAKTNSEAKKGMAVAQALASLNISTAISDIDKKFIVPEGASDEVKTELIKLKAEALKTLADSVQNMGGVSQTYATAIRTALESGDTTEVVRLETAAAAAVGSTKALKDGLSEIGTVLSDNLSGGDSAKALKFLNDLKREALVASKSFRALGENEAAAKALADYNVVLGKNGETAEYYRLTLVTLTAQTNSLTIAQADANAISGETGKLLKLELEGKQLSVRLQEVELALTYEQNAANAEKLRLQQQLLRAQIAGNNAATIAAALGRGGRASGNAVVQGVANSSASMRAAGIAAGSGDDKSVQENITSLKEALARGEDVSAELKAAEERLASAGAANQKVRLEASADAFTNLGKQFAKLGPEGELVSALSAGIGATMSTVTAATEVFGDAGATVGEKWAAGAAVAAAALNTVSNVLKAGSDGRIRQIDKEIAMEKKRDGKSAESVAKIRQLEKKKDSEKKKAFETNKKIQIASIIISTAAAAAAAWAPPPLGAGPLMGGFLTAAIIALGAVQLGIVAGTSYQGGGGSIGGGGSTPSAISYGSRNNTADLASSRGARGELAYSRGESGTGGMDSFKPAFSGYKNRAEGGNTGFVVGEQGPELFVPEMPGRIVPNDDVAAGGVSNVSFNINTVDASGVEDLLVAQRGNIIGMIRQAANTYGQDFVEDVDTSTFTQSAGGVSRY